MQVKEENPPAIPPADTEEKTGPSYYNGPLRLCMSCKKRPATRIKKNSNGANNIAAKFATTVTINQDLGGKINERNDHQGRPRMFFFVV